MWTVGEENTAFQCLNNNIGCLNKNRSTEHFYVIQHNKCLLRAFFWAMCCAKWWKNKAKMKSLTSRRFHLRKDTNREIGNFSVLSAIREKCIRSYGIVWERHWDYGQMHVNAFFCPVLNKYKTHYGVFPMALKKKKKKARCFFPYTQRIFKLYSRHNASVTWHFLWNTLLLFV